MAALVRFGGELLHGLDVLGPRPIAANGNAHRQEVHRVTGEPVVGFRPGSRHRHADHDIFLAREPMQQRVVRGDQCRKQRASVPNTGLLYRGIQGWRDFHRHAPTAKRFDRRSWPVAGQLQRGGFVFELFQPIGFGGGAIRALLLAEFFLCVSTERVRWRKWIGFSLAFGGVQFAEFMHQQIDRPAIAHEMVNRENDHVALLFQLHNPHPKHRPIDKVEGPCRFLGQQRDELRVPFRSGQGGQVVEHRYYGQLRGDSLAVARGRKRGAQAFVPVDQPLQRPLQHFPAQGPLQT